MKTRQWNLSIPYIFLLPALSLLIIAVFLPAFLGFFFSFCSIDDLTAFPQCRWIGLENFQLLWRDKLFWQTITNSLLYLVGVVPILIFIPLGLAILVNQKLKGINWLRMSYYLPVTVSIVVAGISWQAFYSSNGIINQFLNIFPWNVEIPWLTSPDWAIWSVMIVTIWKGIGFYMVIYLAALQSIPEELYEAASIDGSDGWRKHFDITIPMVRSSIFFVGVISAIAATKVFEEVYVLTRGGPLNSSKTVVYYIYEKALQELEFSYACTIGLVLFIAIFTLSLFNKRLSQV